MRRVTPLDGALSSNALVVARRIGYTENGVDVLAREGKPATSRRYVLDRAAWDARPAGLRPEVTLVGVDGAREQLGI